MRRKYRLGAAIVAALLHMPLVLAAPGKLASAAVQDTGAADAAGFDGVVEAVRQTVIAAQVQAARSALDVAAKDYERKWQLAQKQYISQAALERAAAQFRATSAQPTAQIAQAGAAHIQSGFFIGKAPYAGVIAELPIALGDMAMPGQPLLTLYDPAALRVTAAVPQSTLARFAAEQLARVELPGLPAERQWLTRAQVQVLPTIDAGIHSAQVRVDLPAGIKGVTPGMFARVWLPTHGATASRLYVPAAAIVRRAEMTGVYVIDPNGRPVLR